MDSASSSEELARELNRADAHNDDKPDHAFVPASTIWPDILDQVPRDVQLFAHQIDSVSWLVRRENEGYIGSLLGDAVGLGKTKATVTLLTINILDKTLIVCPKALVCQWSRELKLQKHRVFFIEPSCARKIILQDGKIIFGKTEYRHVDIPAPYVGLVTFGKVKAFPEPKHTKETEMSIFECADSEPKKRLVPFSRITWDRIIVDEAHNLRNGVSLKGDASAQLRKKSLRFFRMLRLRKTDETKILGLSGTFLVNRIGDIASVFLFLRFPVTRNTSKEELSTLLERNMFRRNIMNLHPMTKILINFPTEPYTAKKVIVKYATKVEKNFYLAACGKLGEKIKAAFQNTGYEKLQSEDNLLLLFTLLRLLSSHPASYIKAYNNRYKDDKIPRWKGSCSKFDMIEKQLHDYHEAGESCIVFVHFYEEASEIGNLKHGYTIVEYINGTLSMEDRDRVMQDSKKVIGKGGTYLIIANVESMKEGVNAQHFSNVIISTPSWVCDEQQIGRVYRIGSVKPVHVTRYYHEAIENISDTHNIDQYMKGKQKLKKHLAREMIDDNPNAAWTYPVTKIPGYGVPCCIFPDVKASKKMVYKRKAITKAPISRK